MIWKRAVADGLFVCGSCRYQVKGGEVYALTRNNLVRCDTCAQTIEDRPKTIEEDGEASGVPSGVRHQASLGFSR